MKAFAPRGAQHGAAALIVTLMLFLALALLALGIHRHLLIEQRAATDHARAVQAFEAAEAGLDWAQGHLNDTRRVDADCRPSVDPAATTFRVRSLAIDRASGAIAPASMQAACVRRTLGWSCQCAQYPAATAPRDLNAPSFALTLQAAAPPGTVRIVATSSAAPDATARAEATLALFAGLRHAPVAAVTTRDMTGASVDRFFATWFGIDKAGWRDQPTVARVACDGSCGHEIEQAIADGHDLIWIDGDATVSGPLSLGSASQPIVLVVTGSARLDGAVALRGVLYAGSVMLIDARVQGAVMSEGPYAGPTEGGATRDAEVLSTLTHQTGSFVRVPGSWRDF